MAALDVDVICLRVSRWPYVKRAKFTGPTPGRCRHLEVMGSNPSQVIIFQFLHSLVCPLTTFILYFCECKSITVNLFPKQSCPRGSVVGTTLARRLAGSTAHPQILENCIWALKSTQVKLSSREIYWQVNTISMLLPTSPKEYRSAYKNQWCWHCILNILSCVPMLPVLQNNQQNRHSFASKKLAYTWLRINICNSGKVAIFSHSQLCENHFTRYVITSLMKSSLRSLRV